MIFKIFGVCDIPVQNSCLHPRFLIKFPGIAMTFNIGLSYKPYSPFITQFVPSGIIRIMACADMIAVSLLNKFKVEDHLWLCNCMTYIGPVFVTVNPFKLNRYPICKE